MSLDLNRMNKPGPWLAMPAKFAEQYVELVSRRPMPGSDCESELFCLRLKETGKHIYLELAYSHEDDAMHIVSGTGGVPLDYAPAIGLWMITIGPAWDREHNGRLIEAEDEE